MAAIISSTKVSVESLLQYIPEESFSALAHQTRVDYKVHKLYGRSMFYLLLYGLISDERIGQRSLADYFNTAKFRAFAKLDASSQISHSSLSDRLATMPVSFFEQAYQQVYHLFSRHYGEQQAAGHSITRVDSTMVCEQANKLEAGMRVGRKKDGKKQIKYTLALQDLFPSSVELFSKQSELSEDKTIARLILGQVAAEDNVVVFDRGVQQRRSFCRIDAKQLWFITRLKKNARCQTGTCFSTAAGERVGNVRILSDELCWLYSHGKQVEVPFRLIKAVTDKGKVIPLLTNRFDVSAKAIARLYRRRWDIEVFFRFLKQELNLSHLLTVSLNGIKIILYMTLILAMMLLVYRKVNELGYKTAKRRFAMELDERITALLIVIAGGKPEIVFANMKT
ncbi:IS4 family transposase [Pontibacter kalidii]|uniref:IS4 family transposase n=1 Tax=Pontibacter kalidii TaxID=2592049 RepID=UPI0022582BE1|nr:IS4 family transposase [Pontibacter kalidii]